MKKLSKFAVTFCFTGALVLSIGFINNKDLNQAEAFSQTTLTPKAAVPVPFTDKGSVTVVITAEEQNRVENSMALSGFVQQENGPGFFFEKVK